MRNLALCLSSVLLLSLCAFAQSGSAPEIAYESVPDFLKLPAGLYMGEAAGVAVNSKSDVFVFTRSGRTRLFEFAPDGHFLREIGQDLYGFDFAHAVRIDKHDNIWCVDEGSNMVIEFDPQGRVVMVFGRKPEAVEGAAPRPAGSTAPAPSSDFATFQERLFNRPTDVAWDDEGNSYIADGYNNSRVVKYDKNGDWVTEWGKRGAAPGEFHTVHSIATDSSGRVYVGDRENHRIQVFDGDGKFLHAFSNVGAPWAICITPGPHQVLYSSDSTKGRIYKMDLKGNILGAFGKPGKQLKEFGWVHEIACPSENTLFVAELLNWRVQKLILHPKH